ncbi:uncharacterized protein LOC132934874 [Metopolophium dirhodum]|uniref:uncharacterized protein LOC132934874 n=1 Tax=Metopolophium dirhodum TaxID=44670 RepID=UPI0029905F49|nr:uncharacterized protein LOC132934874 [Metopolophium dirhodum]
MSAPLSLLKTAYYACSKSERKEFDLKETPDVDMQQCCWSLFEIMQLNKQLNGDSKTTVRETMFLELNRKYEEKFKTNIYEKFKNVCTEAALHNHIDCLKLAHEIGIGWDDDKACPTAAKSGNLECLKYAHENGCLWNSYTCMFAAESNNLECLKYAHENGCPWDEYVCFLAMHAGSLECVKYARENGCPWSSDTCMLAAASSDPECQRYGREHGCLCSEKRFAIYKHKHNLQDI